MSHGAFDQAKGGYMRVSEDEMKCGRAACGVEGEGVSRRGVQVGVVRRLPIYETQTGGGMEVLVNVS